MSDRFRVNIGLSIVPADAPAYADFGLTYDNLPYENMVVIEEIFDKHAGAILEAMEGLRKDLVNVGYQQIQAKKG